jgi:hypothetical protein
MFFTLWTTGNAMNKLLNAMIAGAAALVLTSGFAGAADQPNRRKNRRARRRIGRAILVR